MIKDLANRLPRLVLTLFLATALAHVAATCLVYGQAVNGTLLGTVTDIKNAVVPEANVTVIDVNTNIKRSAKTNESGNYVFANLPQGTYRVEVEMAGFSPVKEDVTVAPGTAASQWELKLLPFNEIVRQLPEIPKPIATTPPPAPVAPLIRRPREMEKPQWHLRLPQHNAVFSGLA